MNEEGSKRSGCRLGCLGLVVMAVVLLAAVAALVAVVAASVAGDIGGVKGAWRQRRGAAQGVDEVPELVEIWSSGSGDIKVARISIRGLIMLEDRGFFSDAGTSDAALRAIKYATAAPDIRGIILDIDSGGGGITASDIIYKSLLDFRERSAGRVVVAQLGDVAASGAYYIAAAADRIVAHPTTLTGSIGVIMQSYNIRELAAKLGIADVTIKSGENKDLLNPFHELSAEQKQMLQGVIDRLHERFVGLVAERRGLELEAVRAIADGRVMLADQAREYGLVDEIGYAADAERLAAKLLNADTVCVVRYEEASGFLDLLRRSHRLGFSFGSLSDLGRARLLYQGGLR